PRATLALRPMDGVFLSPNEDEFVGRIAEELEHFMVQGQHHRVLLFPPLSSRLRYLIHRTVENVDLLSSFSVGEGWRRRTVICHSAVRIPSETSEQNPAATAPRPPRPTQPWGRGARGARLRHGGDGHGDTSRACVGSGRIKRPPRRKPDKALYVPKAMRKRAEWGEQEVGSNGTREVEICPKAALEGEAEGGPEPDAAISGVCLGLDEKHDAGEEAGRSTDGDRPLRCTDVPFLGSSSRSSGQHGRDNKGCSDSLCSVLNENPTETEEQSKSCDDAERGVDVSHVAKDGSREPTELADALQHELRLPKEDQEENVTIQSREIALEDDCTAELLQEIVGHLTVKDVSIERITLDYSSYGDAHVHEGDFGHVTEIYDFSPSLKTEHLMEVFSDFQEGGFKIQWVDDTHALGIFSSLSAASQALGRRYPSLKIRPLIHATKQSKMKALQRPKLLQLAKERPQTDTVVARRLVTRALGLKHQQQCDPGPEELLPEGLDQEE
ncbi:R3HC1 protein, partial [Odontophorus gujanensis]|nr:R3HC1 protein [Odontophorus gujanensis]